MPILELTNLRSDAVPTAQINDGSWTITCFVVVLWSHVLARCSPTGEANYLYRLIGTWGLVLRPQPWREFRTWYHAVRADPTFKPYTAGASKLTGWYKSFEKVGVTEALAAPPLLPRPRSRPSVSFFLVEVVRGLVPKRGRHDEPPRPKR